MKILVRIIAVTLAIIVLAGVINAVYFILHDLLPLLQAGVGQ